MIRSDIIWADITKTTKAFSVQINSDQINKSCSIRCVKFPEVAQNDGYYVGRNFTLIAYLQM
jgi:hypothetical protein